MARILSQIYFLLTAISGVFMGMNCVLFLFCVYVLWGQHRNLLLLSSVMQFVLCMTQGALNIAYVITAFTLYPGGAESYFRHIINYSLPCYIIYVINYAIEEFLLIWRIYVLYSHNFMACIPLVILLALQISFAGVTAKGIDNEAVFSGPLRAFNLATWALIAAVNVSATALICLRLWIARRKSSTVLSQSKYKSTIIVVIECGALVTITTITMLVLYTAERAAGLVGIGISTQVATMAPLLIIARYGIVSRRGDRGSLASQMPLRISVVRTEITHVDAHAGSDPKRATPSDGASDHSRGDAPLKKPAGAL